MVPRIDTGHVGHAKIEISQRIRTCTRYKPNSHPLRYLKLCVTFLEYLNRSNTFCTNLKAQIILIPYGFPNRNRTRWSRKNWDIPEDMHPLLYDLKMDVFRDAHIKESVLYLNFCETNVSGAYSGNHRGPVLFEFWDSCRMYLNDWDIPKSHAKFEISQRMRIRRKLCLRFLCPSECNKI